MNLGVVVVVEVVRLVWNGRLLALALLVVVVVAGGVPAEAHVVVQHGGGLGARHVALLHGAVKLGAVQAGLLLDGRAVAVHGNAAEREGGRGGHPAASDQPSV